MGGVAWRWLLYVVLLYPVVLLALHYVVLPLAARKLRGRLHVRSLRLLGGVYDLSWAPPPGARGTRVRIARMYLALHAPSRRAGETFSARHMHCVTLRIEGIDIETAPASADARAARARDGAAARAYAAHERRLQQLMSDAAHEQRPARSPWADALRPLRRMAQRVLHVALALLVGLASVEVRHVRVRVVGTAAAASLDYAAVHASAALSYRRRYTPVVTRRRSDGFGQDLDSAPGERMRLQPEGRARVSLDVCGVRVGLGRQRPALALTDTSSLRVYAQLGRTIARESVHASLTLADSRVDVSAALALVDEVRRAGGPSRDAPAPAPVQPAPRAAPAPHGRVPGAAAARALALLLSLIHI